MGRPHIPRRMALAAPLLVLSGTGVQATDEHYPMQCDPSLVAALRAASALFLRRTGINVHILPTSPGLLVALLTHEVQHDLLMSQTAIVERTTAAGFASPQGPKQRFAGRLVLATLADAPPATLATALSSGTVAITDPRPGASRDDLAVLAAIGLTPAKVVGALDSTEVAFLVATGAAGAGLMLLSDVRSNPALKIARDIEGASVSYVAATTRTPRRPGAEAFVTFLGGEDGADIMRHFGLETVA